MKGVNEITLCPAAMLEAMQIYLNTVFTARNEVRVDSVQQDPDKRFTIRFTDLMEKK